MFSTFRKIIFNVHRRISIAIISILSISNIAEPAHAQAYGARQFWLLPKDTNVASFSFLYTSSNTTFNTDAVYPNLDIDSSVIIPSYTRQFSLGSTAGRFTLAVPYASVDVQLNTKSRKIKREASGLADIYGHFMIGLINAPSLSLPEYAQYMGVENPSVIMYGLAGVFAPTGQYDVDRVVNIGTNRWTFRAGLPTTIRLSPTWQPGKTTTLELIPTIDYFTDNNNPSLSENDLLSKTGLIPNQTSQNPIFRMEAHLTQDFSETFWGSLDSYYVFGGQTFSDGIAQHNEQSWLGLGASLSIKPWTGGTLIINGGGTVAGNDNSADGWQAKLMFLQAF